MTARRYLILASLLFVAIFAATNLISQSWFSGARADFTESKLYTLSDGSKSTLKDQLNSNK